MAHDNIAFSIAAHEVNAFTSKFNDTKVGMAKLTKLERQGYAFFRGNSSFVLGLPANMTGLETT
jgi:cytochrome c peroxidase